MSEQQVLPPLHPKADQDLRMGYAGRAYGQRLEELKEAMAENATLSASLAQSEAERERLQNKVAYYELTCKMLESEVADGEKAATELAAMRDALRSQGSGAADQARRNIGLADKLARERELNQGLRHTNDTLTGVIAIQVEKIAKLQLEDKAKPVATNVGEDETR